MDLAVVISVAAFIISIVALYFSIRATRAHESNAEINKLRHDDEIASRLVADLKLMNVFATQETSGSGNRNYWGVEVENGGPHSATNVRLSFKTTDRAAGNDHRLGDTPSFSIDSGASQIFELDGPRSLGGKEVTISFSWTDGRGSDQSRETTTLLPSFA